MSHKTYLHKHDLDYLNGMIEQMYSAAYGRQNGKGLYTLLTDGIQKRLVREAEAGDPRAERIVDTVQLDGIYTRVEAHIPLMDRTLVGYHGGVVQMPSHIGVSARSANGKRRNHQQRRLWWEASWDEYIEWVNGQRILAAQMGVKVAALDGILALREKYPDTVTPGQACERAGIDPREFGLP